MMKSVVLSLCLSLPALVFSTGYLSDPPGRASLWRQPDLYPWAQHDYNDGKRDCGGQTVMMDNDMKCGCCGDMWSADKPRPHELGGLWGNGTIVKTFKTGELAQVCATLSAGYNGYFEYSYWCGQENEDEEYYDPPDDTYMTPLLFEDGSTQSSVGIDVGDYWRTVYMPSKKCLHALLVWTYTTGNHWGICSDGTGANGCGPQDVFKGCADICIL